MLVIMTLIMPIVRCSHSARPRNRDVREAAEKIRLSMSAIPTNVEAGVLKHANVSQLKLGTGACANV
jgi:hypothetical protein